MMSLVSGSVGGGSGAGPHPATANAANEIRAQSASSDLHADRDEGTGCAIEDVRFEWLTIISTRFVWAFRRRTRCAIAAIMQLLRYAHPINGGSPRIAWS